MRLIDCDKLPVTTLTDGGYWTKDVIYKTDLDAALTVDAIIPVRCKDCKHWDEPYCVLCSVRCEAGYWSRDMTYRKPDDFCSYGKAKSGILP